MDLWDTPLVVTEAMPPFNVKYVNVAWASLYNQAPTSCIGNPLIDMSISGSEGEAMRAEAGFDAQLVQEIHAELANLRDDTAMTLHTTVDTTQGPSMQAVRMTTLKDSSSRQSSKTYSPSARGSPVLTDEEEGSECSDFEDLLDLVRHELSDSDDDLSCLMNSPGVGKDRWGWTRHPGPLLVGISLSV